MSNHDDVKCDCCKTELEVMCATIGCDKLFILHDLCRRKMTCAECNNIYCSDCINVDVRCGALTFTERSGNVSHTYCDGEYSICNRCRERNRCERCDANLTRCIGCHEIHPLIAGKYHISHFCDSKRSGWYSQKTGFVKAYSNSKRRKTHT